MSEKYKLTSKQFRFFNENQQKFVVQMGEKALVDSMQSDKLDDIINKQFEFLIEEMFNSDDKEIKIDMSRVLMFKGWQSTVDTMTKAMMMTLEQLGELDDFNAFKEKVLSGHN